MTCPSQMKPAFGSIYTCQEEADHPRLHKHVFQGADGPVTIRWNERQAIEPLPPKNTSAAQIKRHIDRHERRAGEARGRDRERLEWKIEGLKLALAVVRGEGT